MSGRGSAVSGAAAAGSARRPRSAVCPGAAPSKLRAWSISHVLLRSPWQSGRAQDWGSFRGTGRIVPKIEESMTFHPSQTTRALNPATEPPSRLGRFSGSSPAPAPGPPFQQQPTAPLWPAAGSAPWACSLGAQGWAPGQNPERLSPHGGTAEPGSPFPRSASTKQLPGNWLVTDSLPFLLLLLVFTVIGFLGPLPGRLENRSLLAYGSEAGSPKSRCQQVCSRHFASRWWLLAVFGTLDG